ncbi:MULTISPECIES: metal-dependent transcriptional regulator [unclassified Mucilaginibacter]|uniref:metal-dependent transcriptional regulator n=1 Tax=unclassified Mucilaginibacter TaxID=2617802 RepID=UPI002AC989FD|nr:MULTISPECIES: metal-dependent transcriptional regulator [unclassified Mucilaginibacter]MEB0260217.1 metal-dependent transcriptional regulator [Mucilaginibacter sp. 10I4]MEB0277372.1 metal-dependent transcriptional regulator [Mucilaginibacter sp. 10B2]MEB0300146.1 metal-dependent transcriptional regulator [Mucilaginibacter sp. 5C4]WPX25496.1 metal-dependent transcriptional regulator [Mucilaginibacter sp. 5C4]
MYTLAEENYLKAIYKLSMVAENVSTNQIAAELATKASSVTDMLRKLAEKLLINYTRYQGVSLTQTGEKVAVNIIRRHRLWEYFLVEKLNFKWDEVHEMAEEMEHISSTELIDRLDEFMGFPTRDPHGDPIPDSQGNFKQNDLKPISAVDVNVCGIISGVRDHSSVFLQYLEKQQLTIGKKITVKEIITYDNTVILQMDNKDLQISRDVANNLLIAL